MDIRELTEHAKKILLAEKEHRPMLFAELHTGELIIAPIIGSVETTLEKRMLLFAAGSELGALHPEADIKQLCFITEAWSSIVKPGQPHPAKRPSQDPNRKEILMVQILDVLPPKTPGHKPSFKQTVRKSLTCCVTAQATSLISCLTVKRLRSILAC